MDKKIHYSISLLLLSFAYVLNCTAQATQNIDINVRHTFEPAHHNRTVCL